jgi:hypothetical protein
LHNRVFTKSNEVAGIDLEFETGTSFRREGIAFNQRKIDSGSFPVRIPAPPETHITGYHADTGNARFLVVFFRFVVISPGNDGGQGKQ